MKLDMDEKDSSRDMVVSFIKIKELGKAQQVCTNVDHLIAIGRLCLNLKKLGYEKVYITVEKEMPIIVGGKTTGIAIAPMMED